MKTSGMVRQLDALGRIVIPIEMRRTMGIDTKDLLRISVDGNHIILSKYETACRLCGSDKGLFDYKGNMICKKCLAELKEL